MELKVISFSPLAAEIFPAKPTLQKIAEGYSFAEGPIWDVIGECLYFTDFSNNIIYCWREQSGTNVYRRNSNRSIGLSIDANGRIVSAESGMRRIAFASENKSEVITDTYQGKKLNSPNDVVVARDGSIWFTDPHSKAVSATRELDINGVYHVTPKGETKLLYGGMGRPNGIAFSKDESVLYVNDTDLQQILFFDLHADGTTEMPRVLATLDTSYGIGAPDGMKVDAKDNIWVTGPGGIWVLASDGSPIVILKCPEFVGNFCFGGMDGRMLYITASTSVSRMPSSA